MGIKDTLRLTARQRASLDAIISSQAAQKAVDEVEGKRLAEIGPGRHRRVLEPDAKQMKRPGRSQGDAADDTRGQEREEVTVQGEKPRVPQPARTQEALRGRHHQPSATWHPLGVLATSGGVADYKKTFD